MKMLLITGITGWDISYLAELLLFTKVYSVKYAVKDSENALAMYLARLQKIVLISYLNLFIKE